MCTQETALSALENTMKFKSLLYDENILGRSIKRIAHEILENTENPEKLCLIGIKTRGVPIAERLATCIQQIENLRVPVGILDITLYRDDLTERSEPLVSESSIDFDITGREVILTDDVLFTGRTVRAALDALMRFGRPAKIKLAALVDRGHRELPIRPDFVGKNIPTSKTEIVRVSLMETDGTDSIILYER